MHAVTTSLEKED